SEPREGHVVGAAEVVDLDVRHLEGRVRHAHLGGLLARGLDEARRGVDADSRPGRTHDPGDSLRRVAEAAADVEHALPRLRRIEGKGRLAVDAEPRRDDLSEADETVVQRAVPCPYRLGVRGVRRGGARFRSHRVSSPPEILRPMPLNHVRRGAGEPVVLIHGIGSYWRMWEPILDRLAEERDVIAVDLPGFGDSPPLPSGTQPSVSALTDAVGAFL